MKTEGKITISKNSLGIVGIEVDEELSGVSLRFEMTPTDFANALLGLARRPCNIIYDSEDIAYLGKQKLTKEVIAPVQKRDSNLAYAACQAATPEGWECSSFFGSQNSYFYENDITYARTYAYKWIDAEK